MKNKKVLSKEDILHLAKLANLHLSEDEINKYWNQLEDTVEYVKNLDELDTIKVEPTSQTTKLTNVTFEDGRKNDRNLTNEETLKNSKNKKDKYFVIKRIM